MLLSSRLPVKQLRPRNRDHYRLVADWQRQRTRRLSVLVSPARLDVAALGPEAVVLALAVPAEAVPGNRDAVTVGRLLLIRVARYDIEVDGPNAPHPVAVELVPLAAQTQRVTFHCVCSLPACPSSAADPDTFSNSALAVQAS